jgi:hypothetical protein
VRGPSLQPNAKRNVDAAPAHKVNMARVSAGELAMWKAADVRGRIWRCGMRHMWGEGDHFWLRCFRMDATVLLLGNVSSR